MSHEPRNNWQPSGTLDDLKQRAKIIKSIREFFHARNLLEVETPLMCHTSVTDPYIQSIPALFQQHPLREEQKYYLQTSPEYAMKRLLAAGSGAIFQITKAFRQGELGRMHNPEFTMLEWYRPGFDHHLLMDEMDELLQFVLNTPPAERKSYADVFKMHCGLDPHTCTVDQLKTYASSLNIIPAGVDTFDKDTYLQLLMSDCIEPKLNGSAPYFIYDFPSSQSALARIKPGNPPVASRFEVYFKGVELANGFHELQDALEQRKRFENNNKERLRLGLKPLTLDELFLAALTHGLPDCAGVALGIDRLVMLALNSESISKVLCFDFTKA